MRPAAAAKSLAPASTKKCAVVSPTLFRCDKTRPPRFSSSSSFKPSPTPTKSTRELEIPSGARISSYCPSFPENRLADFGLESAPLVAEFRRLATPVNFSFGPTPTTRAPDLGANDFCADGSANVIFMKISLHIPYERHKITSMDIYHHCAIARRRIDD